MTAILPAVLHRYYNLPYEQMILAHRFSPMFQYPQRTGPAYDYYTQTEGLPPPAGSWNASSLRPVCSWGISRSDRASDQLSRQRLHAGDLQPNASDRGTGYGDGQAIPLPAAVFIVLVRAER